MIEPTNIDALVAQLRIANRLKVAELDQRSELMEHKLKRTEFRIRPYLTRGDWESIEVDEDGIGR